MNQPDTQEVATTVDVGREALMSVLVPQQVAPKSQPRTEAAPAATAEKPVETKTAPVETEAVKEPEAKAPEPTPAEVVAETKAPEPDLYASVLDDALPATPKVEWTPEFKEAFKSRFGTEDPSELESRLTAAELVKAELDKVTPIVAGLNSMPPALQKAYAMVMEGKVDEAQAFLRDIPDTIFSNKEASKIPDQKLIDTYFPGKIKAEHWNMLKDPEADPDMVDALKSRIEVLKEAAVDKHEAQRTDIIKTKEQQAAAQTAAYEQYKEATAKTISLAKSSPLGKLLDQGTVEQITSGQHLQRFVQQDGVTPTPEAATLLLYAVHGEKLMKAAETRGYNRGKMEATLETTSRQPGIPVSQRTAGDAPVNQTEEDRVKQLLWGALTK